MVEMRFSSIDFDSSDSGWNRLTVFHVSLSSCSLMYAGRTRASQGDHTRAWAAVSVRRVSDGASLTRPFGGRWPRARLTVTLLCAWVTVSAPW